MENYVKIKKNKVFSLFLVILLSFVATSCGSDPVKEAFANVAESEFLMNSQNIPQEIIQVSIPEGFTFFQIAQRLEASGVCDSEIFYKEAQNYQVQSFSTPYSDKSCYFLEGFLFPDTYEFFKQDDPVRVLRIMLNNFYQKSGNPDYKTLILASIIERETRSPEHMALVSSVYHNRIARGMRLQADATILYVEKHIKSASFLTDTGKYAALYNTYKCDGLPVGPICNPGRRAMDAAKNPSTSDYLYYFFGTDETNHYSKTHEEHVAAKANFGVFRAG